MDLMPWMQQQGMLPAAGETVLCAVSGGRDSVCLLHYLASLGRRRGSAVAAVRVSSADVASTGDTFSSGVISHGSRPRRALSSACRVRLPRRSGSCLGVAPASRRP